MPSTEAYASHTVQRGPKRFVPTVRDVPITLYERDCVSSMEPLGRKSFVLWKGVRIRGRREECVFGMGRGWRCVEWKGVGSRRSMVDCVGVMGGRVELRRLVVVLVGRQVMG